VGDGVYASYQVAYFRARKGPVLIGA